MVILSLACNLCYNTAGGFCCWGLGCCFFNSHNIDILPNEFLSFRLQKKAPLFQGRGKKR